MPVNKIRFDIITLFPEIFTGYLGESLLAKAIDKNLVEVHCHNLRDWSTSKHNKVDSPPYGGGPGMLLQVEPIVQCVEAVVAMSELPTELVVLTPGGRVLKQSVVAELSEVQRMVLLCGRYEGFDQRVFDILKPTEISLGDFILNGGEVGAMAIVDSVIRFIPGVVGDQLSVEQDSFSDGDTVEFPQYTRPREYRGHAVPDVLLGGNHGEIANWRAEQSRQRTLDRR
ncbi:MAG: tRNA (guanosine(37)-N1)-methyltransferase TrmD [Aureliella sp.]